jgi:antirestriction protein ArdC
MSRNTARARTGQEERRRAAETGEDAPAIPFLRRFTVFNTDQCDGLPGDIAKAAPPPPSMIEREAERLIAATAADFRIGGARAFYSPSGDFAQVPPPSRSTGTARPSMNLAIGPAIVPSRSRTFRFVRLEILCPRRIGRRDGRLLRLCIARHRAHRPACRLHRLVARGAARGQSRAIVRAASAASKAADYILGFQSVTQQRAETSHAADDQEAA